MERTVLTNQQLDPAKLQALCAAAPADDPVLFAVIGEISKGNSYCTTALAVCAHRLFVFDLQSDICTASVDFDDIDDFDGFDDED